MPSQIPHDLNSRAAGKLPQRRILTQPPTPTESEMDSEEESTNEQVEPEPALHPEHPTHKERRRQASQRYRENLAAGFDRLEELLHSAPVNYPTDQRQHPHMILRDSIALINELKEEIKRYFYLLQCDDAYYSSLNPLTIFGGVIATLGKPHEGPVYTVGRRTGFDARMTACIPYFELMEEIVKRACTLPNAPKNNDVSLSWERPKILSQAARFIRKLLTALLIFRRFFAGLQLGFMPNGDWEGEGRLMRDLEWSVRRIIQLPWLGMELGSAPNYDDPGFEDILRDPIVMGGEYAVQNGFIGREPAPLPHWIVEIPWSRLANDVTPRSTPNGWFFRSRPFLTPNVFPGDPSLPIRNIRASRPRAAWGQTDIGGNNIMGSSDAVARGRYGDGIPMNSDLRYGTIQGQRLIPDSPPLPRWGPEYSPMALPRVTLSSNLVDATGIRAIGKSREAENIGLAPPANSAATAGQNTDVDKGIEWDSWIDFSRSSEPSCLSTYHEPSPRPYLSSPLGVAQRPSEGIASMDPSLLLIPEPGEIGSMSYVHRTPEKEIEHRIGSPVPWDSDSDEEEEWENEQEFWDRLQSLGWKKPDT